MGSWSTSAPSGVSWSAYSYSNVQKPTGYQFRTAARIARGAENTVYVHIRIQAQCWQYEKSPCTVTLKGQVSVGNTSSYSSSSTYSAAVYFNLDTWTTVKDVYYTGTASKGTKVYARVYGTGTYTTSAVSFSAPDYTTTYAVSYNANGGSGSTAAQTKTYATALTLRQNGFTRSGYAFVRWNTKADGSGTSYNAGASYTANAAVTLYAQWAPNTYAVTYDANGGSGTTEAQTKTYGQALTLRACGFTREHYSFSHWNTKADGTGTSYNENASYTAEAAVTLYAIWEPDTYAVDYDGNGADGGATAAQEKVYAQNLTLRANGFERRGYAFTGWNTEPDGTGTAYAAGGTYSANEPVTLCAQWLRLNIPVYVNAGGTVYQVDKAYVNVGGTVREAEVYVNVGGEIIALV